MRKTGQQAIEKEKSVNIYVIAAGRNKSSAGVARADS
jgi:hypothetical protein